MTRAELSKFVRAFPDGAQWPADEAHAIAAGLDVAWAKKNMGLLSPRDDGTGGAS